MPKFRFDVCPKEDCSPAVKTSAFDGEAKDLCLLLLNSQCNGIEKLIKHYWKKYGGSSFLYDSVAEDKHEYIPDLICGDLDSANKDVLEFYRKKGTSIIQMPDQDHTDFTKTVIHLMDLRKVGKLQFSAVYALNAIWGRLDQSLANINTLYSLHQQLSGSGVTLYLMTEDSVSFLLEPGNHVIHTDSGLEEGHCGLVPLGKVCRSCTTTGLKWNLATAKMQLGGLVSTNNLLGSKAHITVNTSDHLLWTMSHTLLKQ